MSFSFFANSEPVKDQVQPKMFYCIALPGISSNEEPRLVERFLLLFHYTTSKKRLLESVLVTKTRASLHWTLAERPPSTSQRQYNISTRPHAAVDRRVGLIADALIANR